MPTSSSAPPSMPNADRARRRHDRRQGRRDLARRGEVLATASECYPLTTPRRAGPSRIRRIGGGRAGLPRPAAGRARSASPARCTGSSCSTRDGAVLRPAILWNDQRTAAQCAEIEAPDRARPADRAHRQPRPDRASPRRSCSGCASTSREIYGRIRHVLLPKDYVRFRLTGERATDVADASGTLLFDVAGRRWSDEVCERARDPARLAPARARVAARWPAPATRRRLRSASASSSPGPSRSCSAPRGSSSPCCPPTRPDPEARVHVFCHAAPGTWHAMGVMLSAAGSLAWLRHARSAPTTATLDAEAERWPPGGRGAAVRALPGGERTPYPDPDARGAFVGLSLRHDRGALARATLEGVAYGLRDSLELLRALGLSARGRPRLRRRQPQRALAADRRLGPRAPARAHRDARRAPPSAPRCSPVSAPACFAASRRPSGGVSASAPGWSRRSPGSRRTRRATSLPPTLPGAPSTRARSELGRSRLGDPRAGHDVEEEHRAFLARRWTRSPLAGAALGSHARDHVARARSPTDRTSAICA